MEYLATFFTHYGAIKFKRQLNQRGIKAETMPVPRRFSSNCGIGVKFFAPDLSADLLDEDLEKVFVFSTEELVYSAEE